MPERGSYPPRRTVLLALSVLSLLVFLTMLRRWSVNAETWDYWVPARIFGETGELPPADRAPLYAIYLQPFRWLGYPLGISVEYFVTTLIAAAALFFFLFPYVGLWTALLGAGAWIPYMQICPPPSQKLALACVLAGIMLRRENKKAGSYACFLLAQTLRTNFIMAVIPLAFWDAWRLWRGGVRRLSWRPAHLALAAVLALMGWIRVAPRVNPLSSYVPYSSAWWPIKPSSVGYLLLSSVNMDWQGSHDHPKNADWYTNHQMMFGRSADTLLKAIKANPRIIAWHLGKNTVDMAPAMLQLTQFYPIFHALQGPPKWMKEWKAVIRGGDWSHFLPAVQGALAHAAAPLIMLFFIWGAWLAAADESMKLFIIGCALSPLPAILAWPHTRYQFPLIPVFLLAGIGFGRRLSRRLSAGRALAIPVMILLMSATNDWGLVATGLRDSLADGRLAILPAEGKPTIWEAREQIDSLASGCKGVMGMDSSFLISYTHIPLARIRDVLELPPFGRFDDGVDHTLSPERVDCFFITDELVNGVSIYQNYEMRYVNYIKPYAEQLVTRGARVVEIPGYGEAIVPHLPLAGR